MTITLLFKAMNTLKSDCLFYKPISSFCCIENVVYFLKHLPKKQYALKKSKFFAGKHFDISVSVDLYAVYCLKSLLTAYKLLLFYHSHCFFTSKKQLINQFQWKVIETHMQVQRTQISLKCKINQWRLPDEYQLHSYRCL